MLTYTPTHIHTHRGKVIFISALPYYVVGMDNHRSNIYTLNGFPMNNQTLKTYYYTVS